MGHPANQYLRGLRALLELALTGDVPRPTLGVCGNLQRVLWSSGLDGDPYNWVPEHSKEWAHAQWSEFPDHAGKPTLMEYFVPVTLGEGRWEGRTRELRIELIEYLIEQAQAELDAAGEHVTAALAV